MTTSLVRVSVLFSCLLCVCSGCVSTTPRGALIGAGSGAALGAGTGLLISEPSLLGTRASKHSGDATLEVGPSVLAGALVGAVFGATVGAMIGHSNERGSAAATADGQAAAVHEPAPRAF